MDYTCVTKHSNKLVTTTQQFQAKSFFKDIYYQLFVTTINKVKYIFSFDQYIIKCISSAFDKVYIHYKVDFLSDTSCTSNCQRNIYAINYRLFQQFDAEIEKILVAQDKIVLLVDGQIYGKSSNLQQFVEIVLPPTIRACDLFSSIYDTHHIIIKADDNNLYCVDTDQLNSSAPIVATLLQLDVAITESYNIFDAGNVAIVTSSGVAKCGTIANSTLKLNDFPLIQSLYGRQLGGKILEAYFQIENRPGYWCGIDTILTSRSEIRYYIQSTRAFGIAIGYDNEIYLRKSDSLEFESVAKPKFLSDVVITNVAFLMNRDGSIGFFVNGWCFVCSIDKTVLTLEFCFRDNSISKFQNVKRMANTKRALQ